MANYRTKRNYENIEKYTFLGDGEYDIPMLAPVHLDKMCEFVPFNYALTTKVRNGKGVHFFIDDYQFERLWRNVDRYIPILYQFEYVMTPDFSIYTDFPKALQIYNHYRKHWIGCYMQRHGIRVIPTISWGTRESFNWCFSGEPKGSCVAVSTVGCMDDAESRLNFLNGYNEMLSVLEPKTVLFHGTVPKACDGNILTITAFQERFKAINAVWAAEVEKPDSLEQFKK